MEEYTVTISQKAVERLLAGHPWIYRSDVAAAASLTGGEVVRVTDERARFLGRAFYSSRSQIALRLITREDVPIDEIFLRQRLRCAAVYRQQICAGSTAYRLFYGESDGIPSLIVDRYGEYLVLQTLSQATDALKDTFVRLLVEEFKPRAVVERNDPKVRYLEGLEPHTSVPHGDCPPEIVAEENGVKFAYDLVRGQKTGAFLDQRENRAAAAMYACGDALDCFCYTGGFALTMAPRVRSVEAIDLSQSALAAANRNLELNGVTNVRLVEGNVFDLLKSYADQGRQYDTIVLDPPAFAKNRSSIPAARRGYKEINLRAFKLLRPGGILVTCSCSHHIPENLFLEIIASAAVDAHRSVTIVERRTQSRDHPILLTVPESLYIKCFILRAL